MSHYSPAISPIYRRIFLIGFFLTVAITFIIIFPQISDLLVVLIIATVLTYIFKPGVAYLEHLGVHRVFSILSIFILVILLTTSGLMFFIPKLINEGVALVQRLNEYDFSALHASIVSWMDARFPGFSKLIQLNPDQAQVWFERITTASTTFLQQSRRVVTSAINIVVLAIVVPFMTFFFLKDGSMFMKKFIEKIPNLYFEMTLSLAYRIDQQLGNYIRSVLLESMVIGVLTWIALAIMGVKFAVILGIINGLLNSIPFFGPFFAYFPIGLVVLITHPSPGWGLFWVGLILITVQIIDNIFAKPLLISRSVQVHPATVLLAVLIGGRLAGAVGMFIAVPVYAVIQVIVLGSYEHLKKYQII